MQTTQNQEDLVTSPPLPPGTSPRTLTALLVISNLEFGGAQRQVVELANAADPRRLDIHVCSLSDYVPLAEALRDSERRVHVVSKRFKFDLSVIPRLAALARRLRADVIQGYLFDAEIAVRLAGRMAGTPLVVGSERNTDYVMRRRHIGTYWLTKWAVDLVVANSNAGADFNSRALGHPRSLYRVIHNGVDTERFKPGQREDVRRDLKIAPGELIVGMFGSFKAQKNHPMFLAAARETLTRVPSARFMFVGDELYAGMHGSHDYKQRMETLIDDLGLRPRCIFLGNRTDVERFYPACDLTVLPSLFEGTPNAVLESMASGVPVVVTDVSDNAQIVPDGVAGYVVPLADEAALAERMCRVLLDESLRRHLGEGARRWVEKEFSTRRLAEVTEEAFRTALAARHPGQWLAPAGAA